MTLQGIKDLMEGMNDKEALIHVRNTNHERLLLELEKLVVCSVVFCIDINRLMVTPRIRYAKALSI